MCLSTSSACLVSPALAPGHSPQPPISPDLSPLQGLRYGRLTVRLAVAHADVAVGRDAPRGVAVGATGSAFGRNPRCLVAAGNI